MPTIFSKYDSEQALMLSISSGNRDSFGKLYNTYAPALLGFIAKKVENEILAEGILQKAFIEIWNTRDSYNAGFESVFTWIFKITRKVTLAYVTSKQELIDGPISKSSTYVNIDSLSKDHQRSLMDLVYFNNYSLQDAATILNSKEDKLRIMLRRTVKQLNTLANE